MSNFLFFNDQLQYGRMLRRTLNLLEEGDDLFADVRDVMIQMRDNDGSSDSDYATITTRFGFLSNSDAHSAFSELDSCFSKTSGNGSVSDTRAARDQFFARLRG